MRVKRADGRILLSQGKIENGLYEGENVCFCVERNSDVTVEFENDTYTFLGVYSDTNFLISLVSLKEDGFIYSIYDLEHERQLSIPMYCLGVVTGKDDESILGELKKTLCKYIVTGKYEKDTFKATYKGYRRYMKEWNSEKLRKYREENGIVSEFKDEYYFLNMDCPCEIKYKGKVYGSVSEALKDQKTRADYESRKLLIMKEILTLKFDQPEFRDKLIMTTCEHFEWENEDDEYFGTVKGSGANKIGQYLETIRNYYRVQEPIEVVEEEITTLKGLNNALGHKYGKENALKGKEV